MELTPRPADRPHDRPGALVLGANYRALGVVRSLARRGIPVRIVRYDDASITALSRYVDHPLHWTDGSDETELAHLLDLAGRHGLEGWTLIPTDDEGARLLSRVRGPLLERYLVAAPEWEVMRWAYDKRQTYQLGVQTGIDQPRTWFGTGFGELEAVVWGTPAILKPAIKRRQNRFVADKAWPVTDPTMLKSRFEAAQAFVPAEEIMLQELIPGDSRSQVSFAALARDGQVLASITAWRARQQPMDFGRHSTYVQSIDAPDVAEAGRRVIEGMAHTGLVEVEFKRDARDGELKLLDINARVVGLAHAGCAGRRRLCVSRVAHDARRAGPGGPRTAGCPLGAHGNRPADRRSGDPCREDVDPRLCLLAARPARARHDLSRRPVAGNRGPAAHRPGPPEAAAPFSRAAAIAHGERRV